MTPKRDNMLLNLNTWSQSFFQAAECEKIYRFCKDYT